MTSRIEERDGLLTSIGLLVDPIRRLVFSDADPRPLIPFVRSQFYQDLALFREEVIRFCRPSTHRFEHELDAILRETNHFVGFFGTIQYPENVPEARNRFPQQLKELQKAIRAVPCDDPGTILPAQSPYSTYRQLRALCQGAAQRLELFDPYLDSDTFHRYLPTIVDAVRVTIVTTGDIMNLSHTASVKDAIRRDRIVSVSELLALEFPDQYQFRVSSEQHDRHIRVDDTIFHLGGSAKDAAKTD